MNVVKCLRKRRWTPWRGNSRHRSIEVGSSWVWADVWRRLLQNLKEGFLQKL